MAQPQPPQGPPGPGGIHFVPPPGQPMPSPEQIQAMQRQIAAEAEKHGMTVPQFVEFVRRQQMQRMMQQRAQQQQQGGQQPGQQPGQGPQGPQGPQQGPPAHPQGPHPGQPQPIRPGPPNPIAIALANFLRSQPLKPRTVIFNDQRKDMFRVKRALRALQSPAYAKARAKNPALPEITDRASLENTFKLLPMSMLALRVSKIEPQDGHDHGAKKTKRVKGLWNVRIEQQQEAADDMHYIWLYEGSQVMRKVYGALAVVLIFAVVLYPLWPRVLREKVWYLSWALLVLLGLFFVMAIFRVILFCVTYFVVPPGLWLFPNLWEDVSFMDSFRPVWSWHETAKPKKKKKSKHAAVSAEAAGLVGVPGQAPPATAITTGSETQIQTSTPQQRATYEAPKVEELADDE